MSVILVKKNPDSSFDVSIVIRACMEAASVAGHIDWPSKDQDRKEMRRRVSAYVAMHVDESSLLHGISHQDAMCLIECASVGKIITTK